MLIEEIRNIKSDNSEYRKFGLTIGIVLIIIGILLFYFDKPTYPVFTSAGGILIILGIIAPKLLAPLQKAWMTLAVIMGFVMSRVILSILFYVIITPMGAIARIFGKDFLDLKIEKAKTSYWHLREDKEYARIDTERQF